MFNHVDLFPASVLGQAPLEAVYIYFDTATYDEIERDEKVTFLIILEFVFGIMLRITTLIFVISRLP